MLNLKERFPSCQATTIEFRLNHSTDDGNFYNVWICGEYVCTAMTNKKYDYWHLNEVKHCFWSYSPKFKRQTLEYTEKGHAGLRIHSANYPWQLLGCTAFGLLHTDNKSIRLSAQTTKEIEDFVRGLRCFSICRTK